MSQLPIKIYLGTSAVIFGIVGTIHLIRAINSWPFVIGPVTLPIAVSWIGFLVAASLCVLGFTLILKGEPR